MGSRGCLRLSVWNTENRPLVLYHCVLGKKVIMGLTGVVGSWYNTDMEKKTIVLAALAVIAVMNVAAFLLMGHDKKCARQGRWRVPERRLFLVTACFGGLGGVLGMKVFHHKTQHWYFRVFYPVLLALQVVLLAAGANFLFK